MVELWKVMGRAMIDEDFLDKLLGASNNPKQDLKNAETSDQALLTELKKDRYRLSRFERGELDYWLRDEAFVTMLRELARARTKLPEPAVGPKLLELHAAVALVLFDKQFRQLVQTRPEDLNEFLFSSFSKPDIAKIADFLEDPRVVKAFTVLERLGWTQSCREGMSFDSGYIHEHDPRYYSSGTPQMYQGMYRR